MSSAAVDQVLTSMPGLGLSSHHASALRMLGSLQTMAVTSAENIVGCTDFEHARYAQLHCQTVCKAFALHLLTRSNHSRVLQGSEACASFQCTDDLV